MTYQEFLNFLFERELSAPGWYFAEDFIEPDITGGEFIKFFNYLFEDIQKIYIRYNEPSFCLGINYVINNFCGDLCYYLLDESILETDRLSSIASMFNIFDKVFQEKCVFMNEKEYKSSSVPTYQWLCYMWWDIFPRHGVPFKQALKLTDETILKTIEKILLLDNLACKESALHGLGHWCSAYPEVIERIISANRSKIPDSLTNLADKALLGRLH